MCNSHELGTAVDTCEFLFSDSFVYYSKQICKTKFHLNTGEKMLSCQTLSIPIFKKVSSVNPAPSKNQLLADTNLFNLISAVWQWRKVGKNVDKTKPNQPIRAPDQRNLTNHRFGLEKVNSFFWQEIDANRGASSKIPKSQQNVQHDQVWDGGQGKETI